MESCLVVGLSSEECDQTPQGRWFVSCPMLLKTVLRGSCGGKEGCCSPCPLLPVLCPKAHHKPGMLQGRATLGWRTGAHSVLGKVALRAIILKPCRRGWGWGWPWSLICGRLWQHPASLCSEVPKDSSGLAPRSLNPREQLPCVPSCTSWRCGPLWCKRWLH